MVSFLVSSIIGALLTVALTAIAAVDLGSIYKCPKEDYRSSPFYPAYCSEFLMRDVLTKAVQLILFASSPNVLTF